MTTGTSPNRFAQLDTLRALAVCVVMIHHYRDTPFFLSGFGATLFFVLSGFFVTKSLIRLKSEIADGKTQTGFALRSFYLHRWLRLWPLYYLVLGLTLIMNVENARSSFLWNAAFLSNLHVLITGSWSGRFSPLWSLSVLEQFYLIWPTLILCCPRRHLLTLVMMTVAIGPFYRFLCFIFDASPLYWCVAPFASFDQLGCGALLALCTKDMVGKAWQARVYWAASRICVPIFALLLIGKILDFNPPGSSIYISTIASFAFIQLIHRTMQGYSGWLKIIFENRFLSHIGTMSYSIFLLHNFTELLVPKTAIFRAVLASDYKAMLLIPVTVLLAQIAWRIIEKPVLTFRRKYTAPALAYAHPSDMQRISPVTG